MPRVVLDSSVLVSGFLTEGGATAALLDRYRQGAFALCCSPWIVAEVERALLRPRNKHRYRYTPGDVREFLDGLTRSAHSFREPTQVPPVTRDPSDDRVIACAIAAGADYLVTGDEDMLVLGQHQGIRILTPRQFLDLLDAAGGANPPAGKSSPKHAVAHPRDGRELRGERLGCPQRKSASDPHFTLGTKSVSLRARDSFVTHGDLTLILDQNLSNIYVLCTFINISRTIFASSPEPHGELAETHQEQLYRVDHVDYLFHRLFSMLNLLLRASGRLD